MDPDLSAQAWMEIEDEITHPQYGFFEVLKACEQGPDTVQPWPWLPARMQEPRTQLLSKAMLPAETTASLTEGWRAGVQGLSVTAIEQAFDDVTLYELDDDDQEGERHNVEGDSVAEARGEAATLAGFPRMSRDVWGACHPQLDPLKQLVLPAILRYCEEWWRHGAPHQRNGRMVETQQYCCYPL